MHNYIASDNFSPKAKCKMKIEIIFIVSWSLQRTSLIVDLYTQ